MEKAKVLARLIEEKGYSRRAFAEAIGLPPTTLQSMLTRGVGGAAVDNVIKVCKGLGITTDELEKMASGSENIDNVETIAAHHDGEDWSEEELRKIEEFKEFVKSQRRGEKHRE